MTTALTTIMLSRSTIQLSPVTPQSGEKRCKSGCFLSLHCGVVCCEAADNWTVFVHVFQRVGPSGWSELAKVNLTHELPSLLRRMLATVPSEQHSRLASSLPPCLPVGADSAVNVSGVGARLRGAGTSKPVSRASWGWGRFCTGGWIQHSIFS